MFDRRILGTNFASTRCPICDGMFSKCGLPNHIRRHKRVASEKPAHDTVNRRSPAWWDGWKEGYRLGVRDGLKQARKQAEETRHRADD